MVAILKLPAVFYSAIRWPLDQNSSPSMHYQSIDDLRAIRDGQDHAMLHELVTDLPDTIESWFPRDDNDPDRRHFGHIATSLLLLGHGYTDECHNLVTPLSWQGDIHFAYSPSIYSQASPTAQAYSTYVHCLVHRRESFNIGEFGMVGFANANYWSNAVQRSAGADTLPHKELRNSVVNLSKSDPYDKNEEVQSWCQRHGLVESSTGNYFESRAVHELCANVLNGNGDLVLRDFAERVVASEIKILMIEALKKAGYDTSELNDESASTASTHVSSHADIDEDVALSAARAVSSAHLGIFKTHGSITLRRVAVSDDALSAISGIACRLLQSPTCKLANDGPSLRIIVATKEDEGSDLSPGDCHAGITQDIIEDQNGATVFHFVACDANDPEAIFADRLYGTRGETPTTVVQWSKGTIF